MENIEIQEIINRSSELFLSEDTEKNLTIMLAFCADEEGVLWDLAEVLTNRLASAESYLEVSATLDEKKHQLMLASPFMGNPIVSDPLASNNNVMEQLRQKEQDGEKVGLAFYIYTKEVLPSKAQIDAAKAAPDYDPEQAVSADAPGYVSVKIPVSSGLKIRTGQ
ncbi:hypothetical protein [Pedobacter sp.]|uniref:hypothetical protein n=1 Tax=Pedobacter sp. TaxID=1411316 RepID=UPI003C4875AA